MASNITLTAALRSNLLSLQGTQRLLDTTQLRLATGKKVNSALDNANAFFASQSLNFRASDLTNLLDGMGQAVQVLKAADQGITSLTTLVEQAQSIVQGARDTATSSGMVRSGDFSAASVADLTVVAGIVAGDSFTLASSASGVTTATVTITANMSMAQLAAAINSNAGFSATIVDAGTLTSGAKRLEIRALGGSLTITNVSGTNAADLEAGSGGGGMTGSTGSGADTGTAITTAVAVAATINSADQIAAQTQYNAIRTQMNQLITDTGYRGTNLLNGDTMTTKFNETGSSSQSVTGVTFNAAGLGISAAGNQGFATSALMDTTISSITSALATLRTTAKSFGNNLSVIQTRQDFTQNLIATLKEGSDKLTLADKNEEGANLLSLQTSQQLGITALSLASQASQSVLQLFQ